MPIYEYDCPHCHHTFEEWLKSDDSSAEHPCPQCGASAPRLISNTSFILKGGGWYVTEYGQHKDTDKGDAASGGAVDSSGTSADSSANASGGVSNAASSSPAPASDSGLAGHKPAVSGDKAGTSGDKAGTAPGKSGGAVSSSAPVQSVSASS